MRLYYVDATDESGNSADAFAWANGPAGASMYCRRYWARLSGHEVTVNCVHEVPATCKEGVVEWPDVVAWQRDKTGKWTKVPW